MATLAVPYLDVIVVVTCARYFEEGAASSNGKIDLLFLYLKKLKN